MSIIKNLSIKNKLIVIQLFTAFIVLVLFTSYFIFNDIKIYRQSIINRLNSLSQILSANTASAIIFLDPTTAQNILKSIEDETYLVNVWIYDAHDSLFASYSKTGYTDFCPPLIKEENYEFKNDFLFFSKKIIYDGEYLGMISLRFDLYPLRDMVNSNIQVALIVLLVAMIFVSGLSVVMQKSISMPIMKLAEAVKQVSKTKDFSIRVKKINKDEIGDLSDGFNTMLGQIQIHDEERNKAEKALRSSEEKYRNIFNQGVMGIFQATPDGKFISVNKMLTNMMGYSSPEELTKDTDDIAKQHFKNPRRWSKLIDKAMKKDGLLKFENEFIRKNGTAWTANMNIQMIKDKKSQPLYLEGFIEDITEQKKAEGELKQARAYAQNIINCSLDVIIAVDKDECIVEFNKAACDTFGYQREDVIGQNVLILYADENEASQISKEIIENGKYIGEVKNIRKNGEKFISLLSANVLTDDQNNIIGTVGNSRDITELKKSEEELKRYRENLEELVAVRTKELAIAKERAEESDQIKSAFLATMSHELRTPLNSIIGFTGILLQGLAGPLNEEQIKQLGMIRTSSQHLLDLINDILDISKIEAEQLEINTDNFYMREIIRKAVNTISPLVKKKGLDLNVEIDTHVKKIFADKRRVEQILINLLNNAVKFTEKGKIELKCYIDNNHLVTDVSDTGIGIKPEDINKLFKSFKQVDSGTKRYHEGTGLGLSICKKLVMMMNGDITVKSEWGKGSTFSFSLPLQ